MVKKTAKGVGSIFNWMSASFGPAWFELIHNGLFGLVIGLWVLIAYYLGITYHDAIKNKKVIGQEEYGE